MNEELHELGRKTAELLFNAMHAGNATLEPLNGDAIDLLTMGFRRRTRELNGDINE